MTDWRYWIRFEGVVTADTEAEAKVNAQDDVDNGLLPVEVRVEREGEE